MWCPSLGTQLLFMGIDKVLWQELALRAMIHTSTTHSLLGSPDRNNEMCRAALTAGLAGAREYGGWGGGGTQKWSLLLLSSRHALEQCRPCLVRSALFFNAKLQISFISFFFCDLSQFLNIDD